MKLNNFPGNGFWATTRGLFIYPLLEWDIRIESDSKSTEFGIQVAAQCPKTSGGL